MNTPKKIVFKIGQFPYLSETFILAQIITAIKCGYDVRLLVGELLNFDTSKQQDLILKYSIDKKIIIEDYQIPKNKLLRLIKGLFIFVVSLNYLKQIFLFYKGRHKFSLTWLYQWYFYNQFNDVAIFHVQYGTNSGTLALLKKTGFKPSLIVTFHGHDAFFPINGFIPNNGYYDNLFKYGNLMTANTPYLADKIIELGCPKELLSIIPVSVDTEFFQPLKKARNRQGMCKLITVGRLNIVKGHIYAFEVVNKLKQAGYNVMLTVIGEGSERVNLENYIRDNKLFDSIVLVGAKSHERIRDLLVESDIFLFPSVSLYYGKSTETQGLATIEAMSCGLPVVAFDSGGVKYTFEDGISGFVCDEYDIDCMMNKVRVLIDDFERYKLMSNQAVVFANKNFSQRWIDSKWKITYKNLSDGK